MGLVYLKVSVNRYFVTNRIKLQFHIRGNVELKFFMKEMIWA